MATITGVDGAVTIPAAIGGVENVNIRVVSWTARIIGDIEDHSNFGQTTNWKDIIRTMHHLEGSLEGYAMSAATSALFGTTSGFDIKNAGPASGMVLQSSTGNTYSFKALSSNLRIVTAKTDVIRVGIDFRSSGAITVT